MKQRPNFMSFLMLHVAPAKLYMPIKTGEMILMNESNSFSFEPSLLSGTR